MKFYTLKKLKKWAKEMIVFVTVLTALANQIKELIEAIKLWFQ